jgi:hypothetical protein
MKTITTSTDKDITTGEATYLILLFVIMEDRGIINRIRDITGSKSDRLILGLATKKMIDREWTSDLREETSGITREVKGPDLQYLQDDISLMIDRL